MDTFSMLLIASAAFVVGAGLSYFLVSTGILGHARVVELEQALAASESELADYKQQVTTEFTDTAEKFRALNRSYEDLHRQLAKSANVLCGEVGAPTLLDPPTGDVLEQKPEDLPPASPVPTEADGPAPAKADGPVPTEADGPAPTKADGPVPTEADGPAPAKA
ncbi:MAG: DUF1043 family protein [Proteobacteria bacterium]|nr:DUF1043 family protein [Pseudomonadota bacterium]